MRLNEIYNRYKNQGIQFYAIYIREAHPTDGWQVPENLEEEILYTEPKSDEDRAAVALDCKAALGIQMQMLIDWIGNDVEEKYISTPIRLFVVDREGTIAYTGDAGPFGFDPDSWEQAIKEQIAPSG